MGRKIPADLLRHLSFAVVGGFFGAYALLSFHGLFGNAQTVNLLHTLFDALNGDLAALALHLLALVCYVVGVSAAVLLKEKYHKDTARISPLLTTACAVVLYLLPEDLPMTVYLYPIFLAMSFQWTAFSGACGFNSATIFSTNNTKQASIGFARYLCDGDRSHLKRTRFFCATLLFFHIGAAMAVLSLQWAADYAALLVLPWCGLSYLAVVHEQRAFAEEQSPAEEQLPIAEFPAADL